MRDQRASFALSIGYLRLGMGGDMKYLGLLSFLLFCALGMWAVGMLVQSVTGAILGWAIFIACAWYLWSVHQPLPTS